MYPFHQTLHNIGRSVGGTVINDQDMEFSGEGEHCGDDVCDVFLLVVGWYDY